MNTRYALAVALAAIFAIAAPLWMLALESTDTVATLQPAFTDNAADCADAIYGTLDAFAEGDAHERGVKVPSPLWESIAYACESGEYDGDGEYSIIMVWDDGSYFFGEEYTGNAFTGATYGTPSWDDNGSNWTYELVNPTDHSSVLIHD